MSEEEIIKNIKEMIQWSDYNTYKIALQCLLDLYNKEKEKNKELEEKLKAKKYMLNTETGEVKEIPIDDNFISKDKIKEKIKKIKERSEIYGACETVLEGFQREAKLDVLNELLEEK